MAYKTPPAESSEITGFSFRQKGGFSSFYGVFLDVICHYLAKYRRYFVTHSRLLHKKTVINRLFFAVVVLVVLRFFNSALFRRDSWRFGPDLFFPIESARRHFRWRLFEKDPPGLVFLCIMARLCV